MKPAAVRRGKRRSAASREKKKGSCKEGDCFLGFQGDFNHRANPQPKPFHGNSISLLSAAGWGVLSEGPAAGHCSCYFPSKVGSSDETLNADFSCTT